LEKRSQIHAFTIHDILQEMVRGSLAENNGESG
jgi:hypothetical protein